MIINHRHRFIFIKTRKTAGTSIEIALSRLCGEDDVITPILPDDERERSRLGGRGPQHFRVALRHYRARDWLRAARDRKPKQFFNHVSARMVRESVERAVWDGYFKFCFERNPFDKAISRYFWSTREPRPSIEDFVEQAPVKLLSDWELYTENDQIAVDFVGRYENLAADLARVGEQLGLPDALELPQAKGGHRSNRGHYSEVLSPRARTRIEVVCAREIAALGYRWESPAT